MKTKEKKKSEAQERARLRAMRTDEQQLNLLIEAGHGHSREAQRLIKKIESASNIPSNASLAEVKPVKKTKK